MANTDDIELEGISTNLDNLSVCSPRNNNNNYNFLSTLSEEFDMLGLPTIDLKQPLIKILQQVSDNTQTLIHIHRKTLNRMQDVNINSRQRGIRNTDLEKQISDLNCQLKQRDNKNKKLECQVRKLESEVNDLKKQISSFGQETKQLKRYYTGKQTELTHHVNNLKNENHHLKKICKQEIGTYQSQDETIAKMIGNFKRNEEIYKSTIRKLENSNSTMISEVLNLKQELAEKYSMNSNLD